MILLGIPTTLMYGLNEQSGFNDRIEKKVSELEIKNERRREEDFKKIQAQFDKFDRKLDAMTNILIQYKRDSLKAGK